MDTLSEHGPPTFGQLGHDIETQSEQASGDQLPVYSIAILPVEQPHSNAP
jgi:hypothetical protein